MTTIVTVYVVSSTMFGEGIPTPSWVWLMLGIAGVLIIAAIALIIRTRKIV
jgi:CHASE1-domain containing sensor protein